uniref:Transcriptional regulator n=1 Tax=Caenorhabditis tropicalis TaxID=1561998 RepID=A0A1I7TWC1_9PELO
MLKKRVNLQKYDTSDVSTRLSEVHHYPVQQCLDNSEQLAQLHHQLVHCDDVFKIIAAEGESEKTSTAIFPFQIGILSGIKNGTISDGPNYPIQEMVRTALKSIQRQNTVPSTASSGEGRGTWLLIRSFITFVI